MHAVGQTNIRLSNVRLFSFTVGFSLIMSIIGCFTHDYINTDSFPECIKSNLEDILKSKQNYCTITDILSEGLSQLVVGPSHMAFLTESGRVGRVPYVFNSDEVVCKTESPKFPSAGPVVVGVRPNSVDTHSRLVDSSVRHSGVAQTYMPLLDVEGSYSLSRRARPSSISDVPENLIEQVQAVLQGRDRASIARELQRAQLNVNATINSLLNQEDISLGEESERSSRIYPLLMAQEEALRSLNPPGSTGSASTTKNKPTTSKVHYNSSVNVLWNDMQYLEAEGPFISIGAMYSNLIALDGRGCVHQWPWCCSAYDFNNDKEDSEQPIACTGSITHRLDKAKALGMNGFRVLAVSCSFVRANAVLENNKVVTWMDSSLWGVSQLEGNHYVCENQDLKIKRIDCNNLFSVALLENGTVWWWGVPPFDQRSKTLNSNSKKTKLPKEDKIEIGSLVTYRSDGHVPPGSLAFYFDHQSLKMGKLSEPIGTKLSAKFKLVKNDVQNECLGGSKGKRSHRSRKRKYSATLDLEEVEEEWNLSNVVFLYEQASEVGQVVKIDKGHALVEFEPKKRAMRSRDIKDVCRLKYTRILNLNDIRVVKNPVKKKHFPNSYNQPRVIDYSTSKIIGFQSNVKGINILAKYESDKYVLDFVTPSVRLFKSYRFKQKFVQLLFSDAEDLEIDVTSSLLTVKFPNYGILMFILDGTQNFSFFALPTFPQIKHFKVVLGVNSVKSVFYTISHLGRLTADTVLMEGVHLSSQFYSDQNILHFLAYLSYMSEVSFNRQHSEIIFSKVKELMDSITPNDLKMLLVHKDLEGFTPFLYALKIRAYKFAVRLYQMIQGFQDNQLVLATALNKDLPHGLNPLYMICTNELCTYALTGHIHITQDVWECKTCEVVGDLCLCTDCIITCHRGHDYVKKDQCRSAFCDCWQKCICRSLSLGDKQSRKCIFKKLVAEPEIITNIGCGNDHLLLYIVRTLFRQDKTIREFKKAEKSKVTKTDTNAQKEKRQNVLGFAIKHVKKPTDFLVYALKHLMSTKEALVTLFTLKERSVPNPENESFQTIPYFLSTHHLIPQQSCGKLYDGFLFSLLTLCDKTVISALHRTLRQHFSESNFVFDDDTSQGVLVNFIRSCIRLYTVMTSTMSPLLLYESARLSHTSNEEFRVLYRLVSFFKRFPMTTVTQLCKMSLSIISPIIYGCLTQKINTHPLYTKMQEVNDFVSGFFSASQTSISSLRVKKFPPPRTNVVIDMNSLISSEAREGFDDSAYTEDEDEDEEDNNPEFETDESDYTPFTDEIDYDEEEEAASEEFSDDPVYNVLGSEFPTVIESTQMESQDDPASEHTHTRTRNEATSQGPVRRRLPSPFYFERLLRQSDRSENHLANYHWAVRANPGSFENRPEGMAVLRTSTGESYAEGHHLLISNQTGLSRSFMIVLKLISDLCTYKKFFLHPEIVEKLFSPTIGQVLLWIYDICERIEGKLRFGMSSIVNSTPNLQSGRWDYDFTQHNNPVATEPNINTSRLRRRTEDRAYTLSNKNRSEFLSNLVSLMRSYDNDHDGILPHLDLSSCKHVAYLLDGFSYFLTSFSSALGHGGNLIVIGESSLILGRGQTSPLKREFYQRTSSTLPFSHFEGSLPPIEESIPLALHPSILTTSSTKKTLFNTAEVEIGETPILSSRYNFSSFKLFSAESKNELVNQLIRSIPSTFYVRWFHIFDIFAQIFAESVSTEPSSIFREVCRFEAKESGFKICLDRIRSSSTSQLTMENLERNPEKLLVQTFKILNQSFQKKENSKSDCQFSRIKISFKDEPGEGSGVTRNFFAAISDVFRTIEKLPDLSPILDINLSNTGSMGQRRLSSIIQPGSGMLTGTSGFMSDFVLGSTNRLIGQLQSLQAANDQLDFQRAEAVWNDLIPQHTRNHPSPSSSMPHRSRRHSQHEDTSDITLEQVENMVRNPRLPANKQIEHRIRHIIKKKMGRHLFPDIAISVLDSIMQLSPDVLFACIHDDDCLAAKMKTIQKLLENSNEKYDVIYGYIDTSVQPENSPLFFQPGKPGFYFPVNAKKTFLRLNAYRNVGRIIGLALLLNEMMPIIFCRPMLKFLLNRQISFHDFAFYDPIQYESLRMLKLEGEHLRMENPGEVDMHGLSFCITTKDGEDKPHTIELKTGGCDIPVTSKNVDEYIQAYVEYLLLHSVKAELTSIREGLSEVFNTFPLRVFTAEDLRLVLHGTYSISIEQLKRLATFSDESSGIPSNRIDKFKAWFWEIVESFDEQQKSELLLFWTSSPILHESQSGPKPNIVLKQPSDHLPTSNTCIMRLYLPLYNKKSTLRSKLLYAIKTKTFGFI